MAMKPIRELEVQKGEGGAVRHVRIVFGPHHFVELDAKEDGRVEFKLGATHHGFRADASKVNGQLEMLINEVRRSHPDLLID